MKRILLLLLLLSASLPAWAQDAFVTALQGLGGNFNAQAESVERLGALGDPRALPALRALSDGRLLRATDGTLVVREGNALLDAATDGAPRSSTMAGGKWRHSWHPRP